MTWSLVQTASLSNSNASSFAATVTNPVGSGNIFGGVWAGDSSLTVSSITDDKSNTYTQKQALNDATNGVRSVAFYSGNVTNGPKTITVTVTGGPNQGFMAIQEWSGGLAVADPSDGSIGQVQTNVSTTANAVTSTAFTPTTDGDLIFGYSTMNASATADSVGTSPNAFTTAGTASNTVFPASLRCEFFVQTTHASIAATFTASAAGDTHNVAAIAFKPVASSTPAWGFEQTYDPGRLAFGRRGAIMRGDDGIQDIRRNWQNAGWEIQPKQPPHPKPEQRAAGLMRGDDGTQDIRRNWVNDGWEIQPPQPPHPVPEKRAAGVMRGDDGTQDIRRNWVNDGWEIQPHQPQHPKPEQRAAAVMRGDDGTQASFLQWRNAGWELQSVQPPHSTPERRAAGIMRGDETPMLLPVKVITWGFEQVPLMLRQPRYLSSRMRGPDGIEQPFLQWVNAGWEIQPPQPPHPTPERRAAGVMRGDDGTQAVFIPPSTVTWGFEQIAFQPPYPKWGRPAATKGKTEFPIFASWVNAGWEVQPVQPPHPAPERRAAGIMRGPDGIDQTFSQWVNDGWEIQAFQPSHPKPERFGAVARGDDGTQAVFVPPSVVTLGFEQTVLPIRRPRIVSIAQGDDGLTSFSLWQNAGWEIQSPQPPHPRPERSGAIIRSEDILLRPVTTTWGFEQVPFQLRTIRWAQAASLMRGDDGTQATFAQWVNNGWEIQSVQPQHPRPERFSAIVLGDSGTQAQFVPPSVATLGFEFTPPNLAKRRISTVQGGDDGLTKFLNWINAGWELQPFQPPHPRPERLGSVVRGDDGLTLLQQWLNAGWEIQSFQPPHPRPERFGAVARGDDGTQAVFVFVPPATVFLGFDPVLPTLAIRLSRYAAIEGKSEFLASGILPWVEDLAWQPYRWPFWRAGAIQRGHDGTDAVFVPPVAVSWGFDGPLAVLRVPKRDASLRGDDGGTQATFQQWVNNGWEIQSVQPSHPTPERRAAGLMRGDDGTHAGLILLRDLEWPSPYVFPRTRPERSGAIQRGHDGIERPPPVFTTGWEVQPFQPPHFGRERAAAFMRGDDGLTTFLQWRNAGWEIQPFQPSHFGRERTAGIMRGDDGTQAVFLQWRNAGWEIQPVQPPHFGRERQAAGIMRGDDGTQSQFNFFRLLEWPAPPMYRRPRTNVMGALARGDDGLTKFIQALNILFAGVGGLTASAALIKHICVFPGRGVVGNPTEPPGSGANTTVSGRGIASNPSVGGPGAKVC